jgi:transcriptional regulator GlxA family with amidase domain
MHGIPNDVAGTELSVTPVVMKLLESAGASLERDSSAAKACLARATALLQGALDRQARSMAGTPTRSTARGGLAPWQIRKVVDFVESNLETSVRLESLSEVSRLSISYFTRAFRESFGLSPHAYVIRQRIRRAKEMMLTTNDPLGQIAIACGLCDQAHFSKLFRRLVGASPNAWRREHRIDRPHRSSSKTQDLPAAA